MPAPGQPITRVRWAPRPRAQGVEQPGPTHQPRGSAGSMELGRRKPRAAKTKPVVSLPIPIRHPRLSPTFDDRGWLSHPAGTQPPGAVRAKNLSRPIGVTTLPTPARMLRGMMRIPSARPSAAAISDRLRPRSNGAGGLSSPTRLGLFPRGVHRLFPRGVLRLARPRWPGRSGQQRHCRPAERCAAHSGLFWQPRPGDLMGRSWHRLAGRTTIADQLDPTVKLCGGERRSSRMN